jgi:RNA polymerase sigma-70 factor, ECF subfamily
MSSDEKNPSFMERIAKLSDEELVKELQDRLVKQNVINLDRYFSDPIVDKYFEEIYKRYQKPIEYYCRRFVSDSDLLADLYHDVFIKIYLNISRFTYVRSFKAWVYRIAHNNSINFVRKNQNRELSILNRKISIDDPSGGELIDFFESSDPSIQTVLITKEIKAAIDKTICELPREYLDVYTLKQQGRLTFDEVASVLKISSRTVKTIHKNILQILKEELKKQNISLGDIQE